MIKTNRQLQRGAVVLMMAGGLIIAAGTTIIMNQLQSVQRKNERTVKTQKNLETVRQSLVNYVKINGRLPCPASGTLDTGVSAPVTATLNCANPNGTVPWQTLALQQNSAWDGWGRKISYRVFPGAAGMTQSNGADMTFCDSDIAAPVPLIPPNVMCVNPGRTTSHTDYLAARTGLIVNDLVSTMTKIAFVLISHGESGSGAWISGGGRAPLPPVTNVEEYANTQAGSTYYKILFSDLTVAPTAVNHFDDVLVYMTIEDLLRQSGRYARNW
jgi:type II secretory pathway pseudopilin PulG